MPATYSMTSINLGAEDKDRAAERAAKEGTNLSEVVRHCVAAYASGQKSVKFPAWSRLTDKDAQ